MVEETETSVETEETEEVRALARLLKEDPGKYESEHLGTHVLLCRLRYDHITGQLLGIKKVLWLVATILIAGTISNGLALWIK